MQIIFKCKIKIKYKRFEKLVKHSFKIVWKFKVIQNENWFYKKILLDFIRKICRSYWI